jgi:hypothetical protein
MALLPRHRWCLEKILQCFECDGLDDATAQGFVRKGDVLSRFNALFSGHGSNSLFVHYQDKVTCHTADVSRSIECMMLTSVVQLFDFLSD